MFLADCKYSRPNFVPVFIHHLGNNLSPKLVDDKSNIAYALSLKKYFPQE